MNEKVNSSTRIAEFPNYRAPLIPIANNKDVIEPPPFTREEIVTSDSSDVEIIKECINDNGKTSRNSNNSKQAARPIMVYASELFQLEGQPQSCSRQEILIPETVNYFDTKVIKNKNNNSKKQKITNSNNKLLNNKFIDTLVINKNSEVDKLTENNCDKTKHSSHITLINCSDVPENNIIRAIKNQTLIINKDTLIVNNPDKTTTDTSQPKKKSKLMTNLNENLKSNKGHQLKVTAGNEPKKINKPHLVTMKILQTSTNKKNTLTEKNNNAKFDTFVLYCKKCDKTYEMSSSKNCKVCKTKLQYQCQKCNLKYLTPNHIIAHIKNSCLAKMQAFKCKYCNYISKHHSVVKDHISKEHTKPKLHCLRCNKTFVDTYDGRLLARKHIVSCTVGFTQCKFCPHKMENVWDMEKHIEYFHKNELKLIESNSA